MRFAGIILVIVGGMMLYHAISWKFHSPAMPPGDDITKSYFALALSLLLLVVGLGMVLPKRK